MTSRRRSLVRYGIMLLTVACLVAVGLACERNTVAYADDASSYVFFKSTPEATNTAVYGEEIDLVIEIEGNYVVSYFWYRSETPTSVAILVKSGSSSTPNITLKNVSDTGYYHCEISSIIINNSSYAVNVVSDAYYVSVTPKGVAVTADDDTFVYNGGWQTPTLTVDPEGVEDGDIVNAYLNVESAPKNAGSYVGTIRLDNDNYKVEGSADVAFVIEKAPLTIRIKETDVRAGRDYVLELEYEGFRGTDNETDLGFEPTIPTRFFAIKEAGTYVVRPEGDAESANYVITYGDSNLYVDVWRLEEEDINGITADAGGTFRPGTKLQVNIDSTTPASFSFFKTYYCRYDLIFVEGGSDGESFKFNLKDDSISSFCLAACMVDEEGNTQRLEDYSYKDGILTVTLPAGQENVSFIVYYDYTLLLAIVAVVAVVLFIMLLALLSSRKKFNRQKYYYTVAQREADKFRNKHYR